MPSRWRLPIFICLFGLSILCPFSSPTFWPLRRSSGPIVPLGRTLPRPRDIWSSLTSWHHNKKQYLLDRVSHAVLPHQFITADPQASYGPPNSEHQDYLFREDDSWLQGHLSRLGSKLYMAPDSVSTGARVARWHEGLGVNPEELGEYAEGDILFPAGQNRNGVRSPKARWPNGVVPYLISPYFSKFLSRFSYNYQNMLVGENFDEDLVPVRTCGVKWSENSNYI
ncbi:hypothetical protein QAD02_012212 [Eretmocerus hayati]|uniref:Uncharacterized protein n=1 Tax=Eretmocerus hayati TaxID=131215 RepID=A0ACC2P3T1_9HYME|nr:hypothetical protein QAD02_012212 [Eretmocerus hayati]